MIAVDPRGVVVGRTGLGEGELGANLGGLPLVQSALSGNTRDDLWEISGQAYRMAARPIISRGQYYVGAIVHGMAINDGFASTVAQLAPGASVMFFGPDGMYASFHPVPERGARRAPAPAALVERLRAVRASDPWRTRGVTEALPANDHDPDVGVAVFAAVPGMIGAAGGGIALARATPMMSGSIFPTSKEDLARVPSLPIGGGMLGLALLGNLFLYIEFDSKRKRLAQALEGLAQEGNNHLDPLQLSGFARDLAVVANDGIDALLKREVQRSAGRLRNVNELDSLLKAPEAVLGNQAPMPPPPAMPPMAPMPPLGPPMPPPGGPPMPPMAPMAPPMPAPDAPAAQRAPRAARPDRRGRAAHQHRAGAPVAEALLARPPAGPPRRRRAGPLARGLRGFRREEARVQRAHREPHVREVHRHAPEAQGAAHHPHGLPHGALPGLHQGRQGHAQGLARPLSTPVNPARAAAAR